MFLGGRRSSNKKVLQVNDNKEVLRVIKKVHRHVFLLEFGGGIGAGAAGFGVPIEKTLMPRVDLELARQYKIGTIQLAEAHKILSRKRAVHLLQVLPWVSPGKGG